MEGGDHGMVILRNILLMVHKNMREEIKNFPLAREGAARRYNAVNVPVFAPDGFPEFIQTFVRGEGYDSAFFAKAIAYVQRNLGIEPDGFCGPETIDTIAREDRKRHGTLPTIIVGPRAYAVEVPSIKTYQDDREWGEVASRARRERIRQVVLHYDVTFNSRSTLSVLQKRGLSYHFLIDGDEDATIYQTHNPTTDVCLHAGSANGHSIGICLNNPAEPAYAERDARSRGRERPVRIDKVHRGVVELLDFFPKQVENASALVDVLCNALGIPKDVPRDQHGTIQKGLINPDTFSGVLGHYHLSMSKIDPAPLRWEDIIGK